MAALGLAALSIALWWWVQGSADQQGAVLQTTAPASAAQSSVDQAAVSVGLRLDGPASPASSPSATAATAATTPTLISADDIRRQIAGLGLTGPLRGPQQVTYGGRERTVLGTIETTQADSVQTVLLVRDVVSGQIDYWQSGLRIELKPGNNYEAFVREHIYLKRRFINALYADALVDASEITNAFNRLGSDPRVQSVNFLGVQAPVKAR